MGFRAQLVSYSADRLFEFVNGRRTGILLGSALSLVDESYRLPVSLAYAADPADLHHPSLTRTSLVVHFVFSLPLSTAQLAPCSSVLYHRPPGRLEAGCRPC